MCILSDIIMNVYKRQVGGGGFPNMKDQGNCVLNWCTERNRDFDSSL